MDLKNTRLLKQIEGALVKSKSPIINAYQILRAAEQAILKSVQKEQELIRSFAAGKVILIKQIIDKEVELYNLLKQSERDIQRISEYETNIRKLEAGLKTVKNRAIIRQIENEMIKETDNAEILDEALEKRAATAKQLGYQIAAMEENVLKGVPRETYDTIKSLLAAGKYSEKEIVQMFKDITVELKDLQELEKFIEAEKKRS